MCNITIQEATIDDIEQISAIYSYYVLNSLSTLEGIPPILDDMRASFKQNTAKNIPFIVAVKDGEIIGYSYAKPFRSHSGYKLTVEESIYVKNGFQGKGIGRKLLSTLLNKLTENKFKQVIAVITIENGTDENKSASFCVHKSCGFEKVGRLDNIGIKFGKETDSIIMKYPI